MRHSDPEGLYRALGVSPAADPDEIKNAYRRLAKETHPDAGGKGSEFQFHRIYNAYKILSDDNARARYDRRFTLEDAEHSWLGIHPVKCSRCRKVTAQPRTLTFERIYSILFFSFRRPTSGVFCTRCAQISSVRASFTTALFGWWAVPVAPFLTLRTIARNAMGGVRDEEADEELLWQNSRAFAAQGNRKLSYALATKLTTATDPDIAEEARELVEDMEARGANRRKIKLKDPWRIKPMAAMSHLMLAAVLPVGIGGVALQALQSVDIKDRPIHAAVDAVPPVDTSTASVPDALGANRAMPRGCWKEPDNGEVLYRINPRVAPGHEVALINDTDAAAIVKVRSAFSKRLIAAVFMYPHASAALGGIPDGYYIVQYAFGSRLNDSCVSFVDSSGSWQFPATENLRTIATGEGPQQLRYSLMADPAPAQAVKVPQNIFGQN
ncbi:J domain-containing protein [Rhizobium sp.]